MTRPSTEDGIRGMFAEVPEEHIDKFARAMARHMPQPKPSELGGWAKGVAGKFVGALALVVVLAVAGSVVLAGKNHDAIGDQKKSVDRHAGEIRGLEGRIVTVEKKSETIEGSIERIDEYIQNQVAEKDIEQKAMIRELQKENERLRRGR